MCSNLMGILLTICIHLTMYGNTVEDPFTNNLPQRGVNLYLTEYDVHASEHFEKDVQRFLDRMEAAGINSISLTWPIYTTSSTSNYVYAGDDSLTSDSVIQFTRIARARGFGVWMHPLLDERILLQEGPRQWRGNIRPKNTGVWFMSYMNLISEYAKAAEFSGANGFMIATELWSMEPYHEEWEMLIENIRGNFSGILTYASNRSIHDSVFPWSKVDVIGINYFPNIQLSSNASVEQIIQWIKNDIDRILSGLDELGMDVIITETGVTSQYNALRVTGRWNHRTRPDQETQRRFYEAICSVWAENSSGIYWWNTVLHPIPEDMIDVDEYFNPFGKTAEEHVSCR